MEMMWCSIFPITVWASISKNTANIFSGCTNVSTWHPMEKAWDCSWLKRRSNQLEAVLRLSQSRVEERIFRCVSEKEARSTQLRAKIHHRHSQLPTPISHLPT